MMKLLSMWMAQMAKFFCGLVTDSPVAAPMALVEGHKFTAYRSRDRPLSASPVSPSFLAVQNPQEDRTLG